METFSLDYFQGVVAKKYLGGTRLVTGHMKKYYDEAAELYAAQFKPVPEPEELPVLVGHLNREFGYNYFHPIPAGTEVYEFRDRYYFIMKPIKDSEPEVQQRFYKEDLKPCIDFITT